MLGGDIAVNIWGFKGVNPLHQKEGVGGNGPRKELERVNSLKYTHPLPPFVHYECSPRFL